MVSWLTSAKAGCDLLQQRIPLNQVARWRRGDHDIAHDSGEFFRVVAVDVRAGSREVTSWTQPLIAPAAPGLLALLTRRIGGVLHALVQARPAAGAIDLIEVAPTVHCMPHTHRDQPEGRRPLFLDYVLEADRLQIRYDGWLSEEGGRFLHAKNRYLIIETDEDFPEDVPEQYRWVTVPQLMVLLRVGNAVNVENRSLLACLHTWLAR